MSSRYAPYEAYPYPSQNPDVRLSRIRLFTELNGQQLLRIDMYINLWTHNRVYFQHILKLFPVVASALDPSVQPAVQTFLHFISEPM